MTAEPTELDHADLEHAAGGGWDNVVNKKWVDDGINVTRPIDATSGKSTGRRQHGAVDD